MSTRYVTLRDFAEAMGVTRSTVKQWRRLGKLPKPATMVGIYPAWTPAQLDKWLARGYPVDRRSQRYRKKGEATG